jgi:hypothetical protein
LAEAKSLPISFRFSSPTAENFFACPKRNLAWVSGYGAGKTYTACQKALALMCKFPGYRVSVGRYSATELRRTTIQTFYKVCPKELYDDNYGGKRVDSSGIVDLINGSRAYFMHYDEYDEGALRSLEINLALVDQAEEIDESVYLTLDSRVGRWDEVTVPAELLAANPKWPINEFTNRPLAPSYTMLLLNPPDEGEFHYVIQRYHPELGMDYNLYKDTHEYFESPSFENKALPPETLQTMLTRDPEWVKRYVYGKVSRGEGAIHSVSPDSILHVDQDWIKHFIKDASLMRVLDHGASSPTCCTWWAIKKGIYLCYREYYQGNKVVSYHRKSIAELSDDELYSQNIADPAIFKITQEKHGGFWTTAMEYLDSSNIFDSPPIVWAPADNNELATRNRINELLRISPEIEHPVTKTRGAPRIYFCKKSDGNPTGCDFTIRETNSQKKKLLAEINGRKIYSDEREDSIADHAYDTVRYHCATHLMQRSEPAPKYKPNSFMAVRNRIKALGILGKLDAYGMVRQ